jgi:bifunctional DNA-binding transcriptional regulator/antitoxin component of YhaV-PrlF toxin-antitoxin module
MALHYLIAMANQPNATMDAQNMTVSDFGSIHVPARVKGEFGGCYEQELLVEVDTPDAPTESLSFIKQINSAGSITIPVEIRRMAGIESGDLLDATFSLPDESEPESDTEEESTELGSSPGALDQSEEEEAQEIIEEIESDFEEMDESESESDTEEEEEGLGELFG